MINEDNLNAFCKDDITKIEGYAEAVADTTQVWDCHHRLELTIDGKHAHSSAELKAMGMYYKRPYFELILLRKKDHLALHRKAEWNNDTLRDKRQTSYRGSKDVNGEKHQEWKKRMSDVHKDLWNDPEFAERMRAAHKVNGSGETQSKNIKNSAKYQAHLKRLKNDPEYAAKRAASVKNSPKYQAVVKERRDKKISKLKALIDSGKRLNKADKQYLSEYAPDLLPAENLLF